MVSILLDKMNCCLDVYATDGDEETLGLLLENIQVSLLLLLAFVCMKCNVLSKSILIVECSCRLQSPELSRLSSGGEIMAHLEST